MSQGRIRCIFLLFVCHADIFLLASPVTTIDANNAECSSRQFLCGTYCAPNHWRCDGIKDCPEGLDELNCDLETNTEVSTTVEASSSSSSTATIQSVPRGTTYIDRLFSSGVKAKVGEKARLLCRVRNRGNVAVGWVRYRNFEILAFGLNRTAYLREKYTPVHEPGTDDWILEISNVTTKDAGIYMCELLTIPILNHQIHLDVIDETTSPPITSTIQSSTPSSQSESSTSFDTTTSSNQVNVSSVTTELPKVQKCSTDEWECKIDKICIPKFWVCDGDVDCREGDDKGDAANCSHTQPVCPANGFRCNNGVCIHFNWKCDGAKDCIDGEDEKDCDNSVCHANGFRCNNGGCIPFWWKCDGAKDCIDGEDEKDCDNSKETTSPLITSTIQSSTPSSQSESSTLFEITPSTQVSVSSATTDVSKDETTSPPITSTIQSSTPSSQSESSIFYDTITSSNQVNVSSVTTELPKDPLCSTDQWECEGNFRTCVAKVFLCDGEEDCPNGDDEGEAANCSSVRRKCSDHQWECEGNYGCVPKTWLCDGEEDCPNGDDEGEAANCSSAQETTSPLITSTIQSSTHSSQSESSTLFDTTSSTIVSVSSATTDVSKDETTSPPITSTIQSSTPSSQSESSTSFDTTTSSNQVNVSSVTTELPKGPKCPDHLWTCTTGYNICIPKLWLCDGDEDCPNGEDEGEAANCSSAQVKCSPFKYRCKLSNGCIFRSWVCDGDPDCEHGEDELECEDSSTSGYPTTSTTTSTTGKTSYESSTSRRADTSTPFSTTQETLHDSHCSSDQWECKSSQCILRIFRCDGFRDCPMGEDESKCEDSSTSGYPTTSTATSTTGETSYDSSTSTYPVSTTSSSTTEETSYDSSTSTHTITSTPSSTTEKVSNECPAKQIRCGSYCGPIHWRCDGVMDCPMGTDELNC